MSGGPTRPPASIEDFLFNIHSVLEVFGGRAARAARGKYIYIYIYICICIYTYTRML